MGVEEKLRDVVKINRLYYLSEEDIFRILQESEAFDFSGESPVFDFSKIVQCPWLMGDTSEEMVGWIKEKDLYKKVNVFLAPAKDMTWIAYAIAREFDNLYASLKSWKDKISQIGVFGFLKDLSSPERRKDYQFNPYSAIFSKVDENGLPIREFLDGLQLSSDKVFIVNDTTKFGERSLKPLIDLAESYGVTVKGVGVFADYVKDSSPAMEEIRKKYNLHSIVNLDLKSE